MRCSEGPLFVIHYILYTLCTCTLYTFTMHYTLYITRTTRAVHYARHALYTIHYTHYTCCTLYTTRTVNYTYYTLYNTCTIRPITEILTLNLFLRRASASSMGPRKAERPKTFEKKSHLSRLQTINENFHRHEFRRPLLVSLLQYYSSN